MVGNKGWWTVENLEKYEKQVKKVDDIKDLEQYGDFDSLLLFRKDLARDVLDAGCGMGFTTHELGKFYSNSKVAGVDISSDGIRYAKDNFRSEGFHSQGIDPKNPPWGSLI